MTLTAPTPVRAGTCPDRPPATSYGVTSRAWLVHLAGLVGFVAAGLLGRETVVPASGLALTWPAAGVAATWLFFSQGRDLAVAGGLLAAATVAVNIATGAPPGLTVAFTAANVLGALAFVAVVRLGCPELWDGRDGTPVSTIGNLTWVTVASAVSAVVGAAAGTLGFAVVGRQVGLEVYLVWAGRNLAAVVGVFALVHLLVHQVVAAHPRRLGAWSEWAVAVALTLGVFVPVFVQQSLPLAFLPSVVTLWVGLRSSALVAAAHAVLGGAVAVVFTLRGLGPFALVDDLVDRALLLQLFLVIVLLKSLYLAAAREDRASALAALAAERASALEQAALLDAAMESMSDAISVVGEDGTLLRANAHAREVAATLGARLRVGQNPMTDLDGAPLPPERTPARRALAGESVETMVVVRDLGGEDRTFHVHAAPLSDPLGQAPVRAVAVFRDVTRDRARIEDLAAFAGTVAHDLRGPLTALAGWIDLATSTLGDRAEELDPLLPTAFERMGSSCGNLSRLVDDLLAHVTSEQRELRCQPVDVAALAREVASERDLLETVEVGTVPLVSADPVLLRHLLSNLLGNAATYVADGVTPRVLVAGHQEGGEVVIEVSDNGVGIPVELRERVFQRFERVPGTGRRGTGLGLHICRTVAERHGGSIRALDGQGGSGTAFEVRLPAA